MLASEKCSVPSGPRNRVMMVSMPKYANESNRLTIWVAQNSSGLSPRTLKSRKYFLIAPQPVATRELLVGTGTDPDASGSVGVSSR